MFEETKNIRKRSRIKSLNPRQHGDNDFNNNKI